jgi:acetolactate synthase I/II/III large subunit
MSLDLTGMAEAVRAATAGPVVTVPGGGTSLELLDAVLGAGGDVVTVHHEGTAAALAATLGRLDGRAGLAVGIRGPGVANLAPGLALAALEGWPLVTISEAHPTGAMSVHKRMDHAALSAGSAKAHGGAHDAASVRAAATFAAEERPGAVTLDLTERPLVVTDATDATDATVTFGDAVAMHPTARDTLLAAIARARRPLLVAGTAAARADLGPWLSSLGVPVATTAAAKGTLDERATVAAGVVTGAGGPRSPEHALLAEADLVVGVGLDARELLGPLRAAGGAETVELGARVDAALRDEVADVLRSDGWDLAASHSHTVALRDALVAADAFLPAAVLAHVAHRLAGPLRLVVDTGDFCTIAEHVWSASDDHAFLGAGASRSMGSGIAMALASALAEPSRTTVLAVGDGGIGPAFAELTLAIERRLPLAVLVMSDGGYASIRGRALARGLTTTPLETPPRRWAAAAEALGAAAAEVATLDALDATLAAWDPAGGPLVVTCRFDPDRYLTMTRDVR